MIGSSHGNPQSVPSLSHREAEGLISARLDASLSPRQEQALAAHLMSCDSCRAFAASMSTMSVGFSEIPRLPASPTVSRQVRERIRQPQSFWDRFAPAFGGRNAIATLCAAAAMVIIVFAAWSNLGGSGGSGNNADRTIQAAAQASDVADNLNPTSTEVLATNTVAPGSILDPENTTPTIPNVTAPDETATTEPTATEENTLVAADEETATSEPTDKPEPTNTKKPDPTATDEPEPTETPEETATDQPDDTATPEPTNTEKPELTATTEDTATEVPTDEPTETEAPEPTKTPNPKATATPAETATPEPEDTETEEPIGQPTIGGIDETVVATEDPTGIDDTQPADDPTEEPTEDNGGSVIEPIGSEVADEPTAENTEGTGGETGEETPEATVDNTGSASVAILDNTQHVADLGNNTAGAPVGPLMINSPVTLMVTSADLGGSLLQITATSDGTVLQDLGAASCPIWSPMGIVLLYQDQSSGSPQAAIYDAETQQYGPISNQNEEAYVEELPVGWSGSAAYYLRLLGDSDSTAVLYSYDVNSLTTSELWRGTDIEMSGGCGVVTNNGFLIPTVNSWLQIGFDGTGSEIDTMTFPVTGQPIASPFGTQIMYPSGTQLVIATIETPGTAQGSLIPYAPNAGAGYTWSPSGEGLAVSDGASITIYDNFGSQIGILTSDAGVTIAGPQWFEAGIYYLETSPSPSLRLALPSDLPRYSE